MTNPKSIPTHDRPIAEGYGISTKSSGLLSWQWVEEQMETSRNYWICSVRPDGRPHATPVWGIWLEGRLYFGAGEKSRKARNFRTNPNIAVHLESGDKAVMFEGVVEQVRDRELLQRVWKVYAAKYGGDADGGGDDESPMFTLKPRVAMAWIEQEFPKTATRWRFDVPEA